MEPIVSQPQRPAGAGFDPERLARLDRHFDRYVEDGRLPGWLILPVGRTPPNT